MSAADPPAPRVAPPVRRAALGPPASADALVVGGGVAGMTAALALEGRRVVLVTKSRFGCGGSSAWAQGGVAAAVGREDAPALHA